MEKDFKPNLVGFLCNWCSYAGADLAGSNKLEIKPFLSVVKVMCSSRVNSNLVLASFLWGADGVLIAGCHPGDCHYEKGNYYARRRFALLKKIMETLDLEPERLQLSWVSASEGKRYAEVVNKFAEDIEKIGPSPFRKNQNL
ncbi:MAG: hydrogenase iron-sulfur subunit [Candidatus Aminicenantes bacterium]|nr:hydrogenase iron-sulfur subunit [Candidatus Aminicenantes bacterium]